MSELLAGLSSQAPFLQQYQEALMRVTTFTKSNDLRSPRSPRPMTPLPCNDTAIEKSRRQIDQEVLRLEDHIRSLKSQRNFLAPISNLPPEMLAKIFAYRVWDETGGAISRLDWIKVTHVSRHWRSVAFDTPSLWSNIPFTHPRWAEEMLKRSKSAGLTIKANVGMTTPRMRDILELALRQGARIHHLDLNGGYGIIAKVLSDLEFEAPMLQSLVLSGPRNYEADVIIVPEKVLQCEMPYLRLAEFTRCKIHWETQTLSNLHKLKLQDISENCRPSTEQLVELLSRMPDLQVLDLTDALPTVATAPAPSDVDRVIDLPRLTSLVLSGKMQACLNLLRHITVPATATLQLACTTESIADKDFAGIIQFISAQQRSKGAKYIRSLLLQDVGYNGLCLQTSPKASPLTSYVARDQQYPSGAIQLKLYWGTSFLNASTREDLALTIFRALPLAHLRFLNLSGSAQMQTGHWTEIFGLLPKLHNIHIRGLSARAFLTAMIAERSDDLTPTSPTPRSSDLLSIRRPGLRRRKSAVPAVFFPGLRKLSLEDIDFESSIGGRDFLEVLQDSLMERCERKAEVRTLALNDCTRLDDYGVGLLEEIVTDVDWDGCVMGYSDEEEDEDEEDFYHGGWDYDDYDDYSDDYGGMFF